jgi:lipopolysaccharide export system protein LptA
MKSVFCIPLLAISALAQAQTVPSPSAPAPAPVPPKSGVQMIDPSKAEPAPSISPANAQPQPLTPPDPKARKAAAPGPKTDEPTVIDADESNFDPKTGLHTFIGNVRVKSPQFTMTTDGKLDVKMKDPPKDPPPPAPNAADAKGGKGDPKGAAPAGAKGSPPPAPTTADAKATAKADAPKTTAPDDGDTTSQIDKAVATGKLSTVRQIGPDGKIKEGVAQIIIYESDKGTLTLKEWPQVQSGPNHIISTEKGTIMILDKNNHLDVKGRSTTKLEPEKDPNKKPAAAPAP